MFNNRTALSLQTWIGEALVEEDKGGPLRMISLVHLRGAVDETEVHTVVFGPGRSWTSKELTALFRGKAENYAAEIPGTQSFCLLAFFGDSEEPGARKPIMVAGYSEANNGLATEGPTKEGLTQQAMRHSEAMVQMCFRQMSLVSDTTMRMMAQLAESNAQLMAENRDALSILKRFAMQHESERHAHAIEEARHERNMGLQETALRFAPALINRITGREVFPQSTEDTALIERLAESLDEERVMKLVQSGAIPEDLLGALAARMEGIMKARAERSEQTRAELGEEDEEESDDEDGEESESEIVE